MVAMFLEIPVSELTNIQQYLYHDFSAEEGTGPVLLGEISQCNDDNTNNRFNPPVGRFPKIEEDEPPYRLLCNEYPHARWVRFGINIAHYIYTEELAMGNSLSGRWLEGAFGFNSIAPSRRGMRQGLE